MIDSPPHFLMPAEWHPHHSTWLAWPYDPVTFPNRVEKAEGAVARIIFFLHQTECIDLFVRNASMQKRVERILASHSINLRQITFHWADYADIWIRDWGPSFLIDRSHTHLTGIKWTYNAYGNKFPDLIKDDRVFQSIPTIPLFDAHLVMEGGAIDVNGKGTVLTTEECLLNPNRNPHLQRHQIEEILNQFLGTTQVIWLKRGIVNDHTDGHIDEIARFVEHHTIVMAHTDDRNDPNYAFLEENRHILQRARDPNGQPFQIVLLPMPSLNYDTDERAPASYANFYIANNLILVPQFQHDNDKKAQEILQSVFPDYRVVGIDCSDLIYGGGTIHCITQQEPSIATPCACQNKPGHI